MASKRIALPPAAIQALRQGQTIAAIKIVREAAGLDLKAAKELVDAYLESHDAVAPSAGATGVALPPAAMQALARGDLIDAIKQLREANPQFDLKTAKELVERHRHATKASAPAPRAQKRVPTVVEGDRGFGGGWGIVAALFAIVAGAWILRG